MSIEITNTLPQEAWRQFVEEYPGGNIYGSPEMFEVFQHARKHRPAVWAAVGQGGRVLALLPLAQVILNPLLKLFTSRAEAYGGVLCAPGQEGRDALDKLLQVYQRKGSRGALFTELRHMADSQEIQPVLQQYGYVYEPHLNYIIDLRRSPEDILQGFGSDTRKHVRKALKRDDLLVEEVKDVHQMAVCRDLLVRSYSRAHVPLAHASLFMSAFEVLHPEGMARFTLAKVNDVPVATSLALLYKDVILGWYRGVDRAYSAYAPNELLVWEMLSWGAQHGYHFFDFGGAGKPDEKSGVRDFKAKFGGELVNYGRNRLVHSAWRLVASEKAYALARKFLY